MRVSLKNNGPGDARPADFTRGGSPQNSLGKK